MLMNNDLLVDGKKYISAIRASKKIDYSSDYIGQLCRAGKISGKLIGKTWYVDFESLLEHRRAKKPRGRKKGVSQNDSALNYEEKIVESNFQTHVQTPKLVDNSYLPVFNIKNTPIVYESDDRSYLPEIKKPSLPAKPLVRSVVLRDAVVGFTALFIIITSGLHVLGQTSPKLVDKTIDSLSNLSLQEQEILLAWKNSTLDPVGAYVDDQLASILFFENINQGFENLKKLAYERLFPGYQLAEVQKQNTETSGETEGVEWTRLELASRSATAVFDIESLKRELREDILSYVRIHIPNSSVVSYVSPSINFEPIKAAPVIQNIYQTITTQSNSDVDLLSRAIGRITNGGTFTNSILTGATVSGPSGNFTNFSFNSATGTEATTTNFFSTNGTFTNLFGTLADLTDLVFTRATGTSATTTNFFSTTASSTNLYGTSFNLGSGLIGNSTTTNATTTSLFSTTASSTNLFSSLLNVGSNGLIVSSSGKVGIGTSSPVSDLDIRQRTNGDVILSATRATDGAPTGDFIQYYNAARDTLLFRVDNSGNLLAGGIINSGSQTITSTSQPQLRVQYDASNEITTSVSSSGVTTLGFSGTTPRGIFQPSINRTDSFQFQNSSGTSIFNVDTTNGRIGIGTDVPDYKLHVVGDVFVSGNSTTTNATSTSLFSTTASSTNLFSTNFNLGTGILGNATSSNLFSTTASSTNLYGTNFNLGSGLIGNSTTTNATTTSLYSTSGFFDRLGVGTYDIDSTALVEFDSTTKGFLAPRMTTVQRDNISSPATGLLIYNTTTNKYNVYNGSAWKSVGSTEVGGDVENGTAGSVLFVGAGSLLSQDNSNFFWDNTNKNLGIATTSPYAKFSVVGGTSGTVIGADAITGFSGNLIDLKVASSTKFAINQSGATSITTSTLTSDENALSISSTWNSAGTTFTGIKYNVTNSASAANSLLADFQIGGVSQFAFKKDGSIRLGMGSGTGSDAPHLGLFSSALFGANTFAVMNSAGSRTNIDINKINSASGFFQWNGSRYVFRTDSEHFDLANDALIRISSTNSAAGSKDLGLSRESAGVLRVNNGTTSGFGSLLAGGLGIATTSPYANLSVVGGTSGTVIGADAITGFVGNLLDLKVASSTKFSINQDGDIFSNGSTTLQNFTFSNATGTSATTTNFFSTTGTFTNLFGTLADLTDLLFTRATGTSATTTNFFSTTASSTNLFSTNFNLGNGTLGNATSSNLFSTTASSTNLFSTNFNLGAGYIGSISNGLDILSGGIDSTLTTSRIIQSANGMRMLRSDAGATIELHQYKPTLINESLGILEFYGLGSGSIDADAAARVYAVAEETFDILGRGATRLVFDTRPTGTVDGSIERMTLTGAGNLGIGTSTPGARLHSLSTTEQLRLGYDQSNYTSFTISSTGNLTIAPTGGTTNLTGNLVISGNSTTTNATTTNFFSTTASSTNLFSTNFNLGTGTFGNATTSNWFSTTASSTNLFSTNFNLGTGILGNATSSNLFSTTASSTNLYSSLLTVGGTGLVVNSSRNVGIGDIAPTSKLYVNSNSTQANTILTNDITTQASSDVQLDFLHSQSGGQKGNSSAQISAIKLGSYSFGTASTIDAALAFSTINDNILGERVRIDNSGNLGVGTTSPYAKLSVVGGTSGTIIAADTTSGYTGNLLDLKVASSTKFSVDQSGVVSGTKFAAGSIYLQASAINGNTLAILAGDFNTYRAVVTSSYRFGADDSTSFDASFTRDSAGVIRLTGTGGSGTAKLITDTVYGGTSAGSTLTLAGTNNASPSSAHVLINTLSQGNVGIATTSPYARLSVVGGTSGTVIGADSITGFTGNLIDLKVASSTKFSVDQTGNILSTGYARIGSITAPANTTAGDLTSTRLSVGNGTLAATSGSIAAFSGSLTDTSSGAKIGINNTLTLNPSSTSASEFRTYVTSVQISSGNAQTFSDAVEGTYSEIRMLGSGSLSQTNAVRATGLILPSAAVSFGTVTDAISLLAIPVSEFASSNITGTVTNSRGVRVNNISKTSASLTITNQIGLNVESLTTGSNNTHVLLGQATAPSGNYSIYSSTASQSYFAGNFGLGTTTPGEKLQVHDGEFRLSDVDITHGFTTLSTTNSVLDIEPLSGTVGGALLTGYGESSATAGLVLRGLLGASDPTDATPAVQFRGGKQTGTTGAALGSLETAFQFSDWDGGTDWVTVLGSGNVGIGTASPVSKLHVAGGGYQQTTDNTGHTSTDGFAIEHSGNEVILRQYESSSLNFYTSNTERVRITSAGNVGVGTTTPWGKLSVTNTGTSPSFVVEDDTSPDSTPFLIDASGNVGVGTASPVQKLDVVGTITSTVGYGFSGATANNGGMFFSGSDLVLRSIANSAGFYFQDSGGASTFMRIIGSTGNVGIATSTPWGKLSVTNTGSDPSFVVEDSTSPDSSPFLIDASGNTGIGTASPNYKLDVASSTTQIRFGTSAVDSGGFLTSTGTTNSSISGGASYNGTNWIAKDTSASIIQNNTGNISFYQNTGLTGGNSFTPTEKMRVDSSGVVAIATLGSSSSTSICRNAIDVPGFSTFSACTSSIRFKENVQSLEIDKEKILALNPVSFKWKGRDEYSVGFIAEEVVQLIPEIVNYDSEGRIEGLEYKLLTPYIIGILKENDQTLTDHSQKIEGLEIEVLAAQDIMSDLAFEIDNLDFRISDVELRLADLETASSGLSIESEEDKQALVAVVLQGIEAVFEDGWLKFKQIAIETLRIGSPEKPSGITFYDEDTGEPYCVKVKSGVLATLPGECGRQPVEEVVVTETPITSGSGESASTTASTTESVENTASSTPETTTEVPIPTTDTPTESTPSESATTTLESSPQA
jgi:hypothetical protein